MNPPEQPPERHFILRALRAVWIVFCTVAGAVIVGVFVGFACSNLSLGLAAAVPGGVLGYLLGRVGSPLDLLAPPSWW